MDEEIESPLDNLWLGDEEVDYDLGDAALVTVTRGSSSKGVSDSG